METSFIEETILIDVNQIGHDLLQSVGKKFGQNFDSAVKQRNGPKSTRRVYKIDLGYECDIGVVDALDVDPARIEIIDQIVEVWGYDVPTRFEKSCIKAIWSR